MEENNIALNDQYIKYCVHGGEDPGEIELALNELLFSENRPDALFTASDRISTTTLPLLHKLGLKIPHDIALLGFTNTCLTDILNPP